MESPLKGLYNASGTSIKYSDWPTVWSMTTGLWCVGGMIGALVGGPAANALGRKRSLLLTNVFTLIGSILEAYPMGFYVGGDVFVPERLGLYDYVLSGRFINGIGCGLSTTLAPLFLTEISPLRYRGIFGTLNQFGVVIGMLVAWVVGLPELGIGNIGSSALNSYTFVLGLPVAFGAIQLAILPFCAESPLYLWSQGKFTEAEKAFKTYG